MKKIYRKDGRLKCVALGSNDVIGDMTIRQLWEVDRRVYFKQVARNKYARADVCLNKF